MILIVSPHLDDARLGCCDHALAWRQQGWAVRAVTLFSAAGPCISPVLSSRVMGALDPSLYMQRRRNEDADALASVGLTAEHLGLVDAGFRGTGTPDFQSLAQLWCGNAGPDGAALVEQAAQALRAQAAGVVRVLSPLAVGGHVDHVIARQACERAFDASQLSYYADMPYARVPWRWRAPQMTQAVRSRRSWHWVSPAKVHALQHYASQMPLVWGRTPRFPELVLGPP